MITSRKPLLFTVFMSILCMVRAEPIVTGHVDYLSIEDQEVVVEGRIISAEDNLGLPGVTVLVKGTDQGTVSDIDGNYRITVPAGDAVLVFSFIGFVEQEVAVENKSVINVTMLVDVQSLEEIVVVGTVMKRGDLTGAVTSIDGEKLQEIPTTNVNQAMSGRMAGVRIQNNPGPNGGASIQIRGNNSIQFGTNPIYVVDGLVIDGGFNMINPDDIASIEVLKDASSTALYGSRGSNGVVIITTKKGRSGEGKITYNGWVGFEEFSNLMPRMNAQQIYELRVDAYANTFMDENPGANRQSYIDNFITGENSIAFADYEQETYSSGQSYNWLDEIIRQGRQQNHTVSFSKGTNDGSYYVSLNYTDQTGLLKNSGYERISGKINVDQNVKPWLKIGTSTSYTKGAQSYIQGGVFSIANGANPLLAVNDSINYLRWADIESVDLYNPIRSLRIDGEGNQDRIMSSSYLNIKLGKGLNLRTTYSIDVMGQQDFWYTPKDIGQSLRNSTEGSASHRKDKWLNWQWDNSISYNYVNGRHELTSLAGFGMYQYNWNYNQINAAGFATDDFSYKYLGGAYNRDQWGMSSDFTTSSLMSFFGRANYSFGDKYFVTGTLRFDGSSRFGAGHKWGAFPSVALAWDVSRESFFNVGFVDKLKLRTGYGIAGNQNIPNFAYRSLYRPVITNNSLTYVSDGRLGNPVLEWEKQKQLNIGLDLAVLNSRITMAAEYFLINNEDLLMQRSLSSTTGYSNTIANVGALENKGVELTLTADVIRSNTFSWTLSGNISSAVNKITRLYGDVDAIYNRGGFTGVEIQREGNLFLGESLNSIYVYKFEKIAQESDMEALADMDFGGRIVRPGDIVPMDIDNNGIINNDDRYVVGNKDPKFYGGFTSDMRLGNFSLNTVFTYNYGAKRISYLYESFMYGSGVAAASTDMLDRWTPENTDTNVPRAYYAGGRYNMADVDLGVQDASFLRLSAATLDYTFDSQWTGKLGVENLRVYVTGSNLFVITKYKGYDPEGGDDYPMSRMWVTGLSVSF